MASVTDNRCLSVDPISGPSDPWAAWHSCEGACRAQLEHLRLPYNRLGAAGAQSLAAALARTPPGSLGGAACLQALDLTGNGRPPNALGVGTGLGLVGL